MIYVDYLLLFIVLLPFISSCSYPLIAFTLSRSSFTLTCSSSFLALTLLSSHSHLTLTFPPSFLLLSSFSHHFHLTLILHFTLPLPCLYFALYILFTSSLHPHDLIILNLIYYNLLLFYFFDVFFVL